MLHLLRFGVRRQLVLPRAAVFTQKAFGKQMAGLAMRRRVAHQGEPQRIEQIQRRTIAVQAAPKHRQIERDVALLRNHAQGFQLGELAALIADQHRAARVDKAVAVGVVGEKRHFIARQGRLQVVAQRGEYGQCGAHQ